jgi:hypothetical protein
MAAFDLTSTDVCSVLLGGRMSENGTTVKCYRDGMQVFRGAYRVAGVFFDGERHYWEELEWEGSLVRQLDDLAAEAGIYGIGFVYIGSGIDRSEDKDIIKAVFYEWLEEVKW